MVVHQRAHPALGGVDEAHQGTVVHVLFVQRAIEAPPELPQDLGKVFWRAARERNPARQRAVQVRVAVDQRGH